MNTPLPARLQQLDSHVDDDGTRLFVAESRRARLLGLAFLDAIPEDCGLLIPRCSSVHTFGMRFALDIAFLDADGAVLRRAVMPPRRLAWCRGAAAVVERRA